MYMYILHVHLLCVYASLCIEQVRIDSTCIHVHNVYHIHVQQLHMYMYMYSASDLDNLPAGLLGNDGGGIEGERE